MPLQKRVAGGSINLSLHTELCKNQQGANKILQGASQLRTLFPNSNFQVAKMQQILQDAILCL